MLHKVARFAEIGRFRTLRHKAPQFSKLALVFARNAHGKSTICAVLRSAATGDVAIVGARRRLGSTTEPAASFEWGPATVSFANGKWNVCPGPLHLFDQEYVERNVHLAGSVTRANKRQLLQIVIGQEGIKLAQEIEGLDRELKQMGTDQAATARVIQTAHRVVTDVAAYCSNPVPGDIEDRIDRRQRAVELARRAAAVSQRGDLQKLQVDDLAAYEAVFGGSVDDVSTAAAEAVADHIEQHALGPSGARWLKFGVDHMVGTACPFCNQNTSGVPAVDAFKGYFSEAYSSHLRRIEEVHHALQTAYGDDGSAFRTTLSRARVDVQFWSEVCELPMEPRLSAEEEDAVMRGLQVLRDAFARKVAAPLDPISLGEARDDVERGLSSLFSFNRGLEACGAAITQARGEAVGADVARAQQALAQHQAWKAKQSDPMKSEVEAFGQREARKAAIADRKAQLQQQLKNYVAQTITARQSQINRLLRLFGANFEIADTTASFVGREPNTEYSLVIGKHAIKAGEDRPDAPSFKTVLSAGDKFTLALAFFLTQARADPKLADAAVVLDDPFSSQDMQRQFETANQIRSLAAAACQVIVLSHDPRFLHLIEKDADPKICSTFQVSFEDDATAAIKVWSSAKELESLYVRQAERIRAYGNGGQLLTECTAESLVKDLRPFTEEFLKQRFPGRFGPLEMLDSMADGIAEAGAADPLYLHVEDLKVLNEYTRPYMHGGAPPPDPGQLRAQCGRVVDIIGRY
jgi:wobble nucleotide-excising tRNase